MEAQSRAGKKVIICVEDVHRLANVHFEFLFGLADTYPCVRLLLTSSENIGESIEERCQLIDIEPFTQKQTAEYARFRVNRQGLAFVNLAGIDDVVLFIETGGLPGRINDVLDSMAQTTPSKLSDEEQQKARPFPWVWGG